MKDAVNTPRYLYRFFDKKEYRDQFVQGSIRFRNLEFYKKTEDVKRRDVDEGKARGKYKTEKMMYLKISNKTGKVLERGYKAGTIFITGDSPNRYFIVALAGKSVDLKAISKKFGRYVVKVNDVGKFLELLNNNCKFSWKVGKIILEQVKYDKDNYITMEENNPHLPVGYHFAQKPVDYAEECEWRIVLTGSAIEEVSEEHPTIEIGLIEDITSVQNL